MASVFGNPVTDATVMSMPGYSSEGRKISQSQSVQDRASAAFELKHSEGKDVAARKFLEDFRKTNGVDYIMCLVYNATGNTVTFCAYRHQKADCASPYPMVIQNGQWGAFLLSIPDERGGVAFTYSGENELSQACDWTFNLSMTDAGNRVFTEIRGLQYYSFDLHSSHWENLENRLHELDRRVHEHHARKCSSFVSIGASTSPYFEATMTLEDAW